MSRNLAIPILPGRRTLTSARVARRFRLILVIGLISLLRLTVASPIAATELCVSTVEELRFALEEAHYNPVVVKLVQGTYDIGSAPFPLQDSGWYPDGIYPRYSEDVTLLGGYSTGCASRTLNPLFTVITGGGRFALGSDHDIKVESIRFTNARGLLFDNWAGDHVTSTTLSRVRIEGAAQNTPLVIHGSETVVLSQTIVANNPHTGCAVRLSGSANGFGSAEPELVRVSFSVIAANGGKGLCVNDNENPFLDTLRSEIYNSIFWGNAGVDLEIRNPDQPDSEVLLRNNILPSTSILPASSIPPVGTLNADPLFGNPGAGIFVPLGASPAVNSGASNVPGGVPTRDIAGATRPIGTPDRGAHETLIDDSVVLTVTTTADAAPIPPAGSLRAAILAANANPSTYNEIQFAIPGAGCPKLIDLATELPDVVGALTVNGFSQSGASPNTQTLGFGNDANLCVALRGSGARAHGLQVAFNTGALLKVKGLGFGGFTVGALRLSGGSGHVVEGNQFGGSIGATALGVNAVGIRIGGSSSDTTVGGAEPEQQNLVMGSSGDGIQILTNSAGADTSGNQIVNNLVGTAASGLTAVPNANGIHLFTAGTWVTGNVVSGNTTDGIALDGLAAVANFIVDNRLGVAGGFVPFGSADLPNGRFGLLTENDASRNQILLNWIAYNGDDGVRLFTGERNRVQSNRIHDNGALGIDVGTNGIDAIDNDTTAAQAAYANRGINRPSMGSAFGNAGNGTLNGVITSTNGIYTVQAFTSTSCDPSGYGEGRDSLGSVTVQITDATASANGFAVFAVPLVAPVGTNLIGKPITALVTDALGHTSELSSCVTFGLGNGMFSDGFESGAPYAWSRLAP